jgi:hypothetical protein
MSGFNIPFPLILSLSKDRAEGKKDFLDNS